MYSIAHCWVDDVSILKYAQFAHYLLPRTAHPQRARQIARNQLVTQLFAAKRITYV